MFSFDLSGRFFAICFALFCLQLAFAHEGASGVVKARMDAMEHMSVAMKQISAMMRGREPYDAAKVSELALKISEQSGTHLLILFPESIEDDLSRARADIWVDWSAFEAYALELDVLAKGLARAAQNNSATKDAADVANNAGSLSPAKGVVETLATRPASSLFRQISRNCSGCHTQFREKERR